MKTAGVWAFLALFCLTQSGWSHATPASVFSLADAESYERYERKLRVLRSQYDEIRGLLEARTPELQHLKNTLAAQLEALLSKQAKTPAHYVLEVQERENQIAELKGKLAQVSSQLATLVDQEKQAATALVRAAQDVPPELLSQAQALAYDARSLPELVGATSTRERKKAAEKLGQRAALLLNEIESIETQTNAPLQYLRPLPVVYRDLLLTFVGLHALADRGISEMEQEKVAAKWAQLSLLAIVPAYLGLGASLLHSDVISRGVGVWGVINAFIGTAITFGALAFAGEPDKKGEGKSGDYGDAFPFIAAGAMSITPALVGIVAPGFGVMYLGTKVTASQWYAHRQRLALFERYYRQMHQHLGKGGVTAMEAKLMSRLAQTLTQMQNVQEPLDCVDALNSDAQALATLQRLK